MTTLINHIFESVNVLVPEKSVDPELLKTLEQGKEFKNYQKKIAKRLNYKIKKSKIVEGFTAQQSQEVLDQNKLYEHEVAELKTLENEYNTLLNQLQTLESSNIGGVKTFLDVTDPNNKWNNKNVQFTGNHALGYVTNRGDYKVYPSKDVFNNTAGKNGCPKNSVNINYSGKDYDVPGTILDTNPSLIVGTPMQSGQSCGNEGTNVYVNSILSSNVEPTYSGCYTDNSSAPSMTFVGGSPPAQGSIVNGNFSQPAISNNTYQYITGTSQVPGWNFNAFLINNSTAWGYPIPYPSGNQCACIQKTQEMSQTLDLSVGKYTLTFFAAGRNCCDGSGLSNPIKISLDGTAAIYSGTIQPAINKWDTYSTSFNVSKKGNYVLHFQGTWSAGDRSTAIQNVSISGLAGAGSYTFDMCKEAAMAGGYRYFALQGVNPQTSSGFCAVSNDSVGTSNNGPAKVVSSATPLWSSKTAGKTGCSAIFTTQGALSVVQNNTSIFSTPNANATPSDYLGCYGDGDQRAMPLYNNGSQQYNRAQCKAVAQQTGAKYFALQDSESGTDAQCGTSNNLSEIRQYGKAGNCTKLSDGSYSGGGWSNAVYSTSHSSVYFLILQDDGNLCIYRGSGPDDNQGLIWAAGTNGKQQKPNPLYAASKGKYGQNYISSGATMAAGDFVGSTDGTTYLIMQADGNLVFYTSKNAINCSKMADNNMGGGVGANALYDLGSTGHPNNVGKFGYVDNDGSLSEYPSSMIGMTTKYTKFQNTNSPGNDIISGPISNSTIASCKKICDDSPYCSGYVFDNENKVCLQKNNNMNKNTAKVPSTSTDLYVREPGIIKAPGSTKPMNYIDSVKWQNYKNTGKPVSANTFSNSGILTSSQKKQVDQLTTRLNLLAKQITDKTNELMNKNGKMNDQMHNNKLSFKNSSDEFSKVTSIDQTAQLNNIGGIVKDSNIVVLHENYRYLVWSILAVAVVSLSINVLKK